MACLVYKPNVVFFKGKNYTRTHLMLLRNKLITNIKHFVKHFIPSHLVKVSFITIPFLFALRMEIFPISQVKWVLSMLSLCPITLRLQWRRLSLILNQATLSIPISKACFLIFINLNRDPSPKRRGPSLMSSDVYGELKVNEGFQRTTIRTVRN